MHHDVIDLRRFYYQRALGRVVQRILRDRLCDLWPPQGATGMSVAGYGFAAPLLRPYLATARRVTALMPAPQGVMAWPAGLPNVSVLCEETRWPVATGSADRLVLLHALEMTDRPYELLEECWRVLAPQGRAVFVAPNRSGLWVRGEGTRTRLIGRERGYHGVGFGGISVGGIVNNRRFFGSLLAGVDHLPHTHLPENRMTRGQPDHGAHLADELERLVALHGAETIAAVIVEPMAGSTGVLMPPKGYLQRLREITRKHGILLIFDEVITGFGRLGSPFAAQHFGVVPDMITCAKGLTNGVIPMGAVLTSAAIHDAFMSWPDHVIELFHGYTYSGNPIASAAGVATLDTYAEEWLLTRAASLETYWENALHGLADHPHVVDVRNMGLIGAVELAPIDGQPGKRAFDAFVAAFEAGILVRVTGDIIALSPPLIISEAEIDELVGTLGRVLKAAA